MRKYRLGKEKADWARGLIRASVNKLPEHRFLHRLHFVILVAEGHSCADVARWFGGTRRTIERWVHSFEADGIEGLREQHHGGGRSSRLTESRLRELAVDLDRPPVVSGYPDRQWSGRLVAPTSRVGTVLRCSLVNASEFCARPEGLRQVFRRKFQRIPDLPTPLGPPSHLL